MRAIFLIILNSLPIFMFSQGNPTVRDVLKQIHELPDWYKNDTYDGNNQPIKDSTYRFIVNADTFSIVKLIPFLTDTTLTNIDDRRGCKNISQGGTCSLSYQ